MDASVPSQNIKRKLHRKVFERIKESKMGNIFATQTTLKHKTLVSIQL